MKAREFDKKFDEGGDISQHLDISKARRPEQEQKMNYDDDKIDECTLASSTWLLTNCMYCEWDYII